MILSLNKSYYRKDNIVFESGTNKSVVKFKQWFPDVEKLTEEAIKYINKYCSMYPELYEKTNSPQQLSFF